MKRTLYHGSDCIIEKPQYGLGNIHNDYGLGFYCCSNLELAKEWASKNNGYGFVNKYEIRDDNLKILDLTKGENNNVLTWLTLLINNRTMNADTRKMYSRELQYLKDKYLINIKSYDVIIGYRADDAYFRFPESFIRSEITLESLEKIYKAGDLGKQYVLKSEHAFKLLKFISSIESEKKDMNNYYDRKKEADKEYSQLIIDDRYTNGTRIIDLVKDNV